MFGEESPAARPVIRPEELRVAPELIEDFPVFDPRSVPKLVVNVSWQIERQQATDFARWITGHPSPPARFVFALSEQENHLRIAISKQVHLRSKDVLDPKVKAVRKACKTILRFMEGIASHKNGDEQAEGLHRATETLRRLVGDRELVCYLFKGEPIRFLCEDGQFLACLSIINGACSGTSKHLKPDLATFENLFISDLNFIGSFAHACLSSSGVRGRPKKNRMTAVASEAIGRGNQPSHYEQGRIIERRTWSAELLCAVIVHVGFAWRDSSDSCYIFSNEKFQACEDLWQAAGGPAHDGEDDEAYKFWGGKIKAARQTDRAIWQRVEHSFAVSGWSRPFDQPVPAPNPLRDRAAPPRYELDFQRARRLLSEDSRVVQLPEDEYQAAVQDLAERLDRIPAEANDRELVTLKDATDYIKKLQKADRDAPEWRAAMEVLSQVAKNGGSTALARTAVRRALSRNSAGASACYMAIE